MALEPAFSLRRIMSRLTEGIDGPLLVLTMALSLLGLAALFSASYDTPSRVFRRRSTSGSRSRRCGLSRRFRLRR